MIDIDREILKSGPEHRDVLLSEKQTYERIHTITKSVLAEVGIETKNKAVIELLEATGLAGRTAPQTPEGCIIITHAEVMFMLAVAQTINPGMLCMFGGMPCTTKPDGDLAYSHDAMNLLNVAVARLNMWVTGLPSVQSGGSTEEKKPNQRALADGIRGCETLCGFGVHNARHCFGVLDNLNFFSEAAFIADCDAQRQYVARRISSETPQPLYLPRDDKAFEVIQRVASFDYHVDDHTTANLSAFEDWATSAVEMGVLSL